MEKHFCNCPGVNCPQHPRNHHQGCDPCIQDNLAKHKMPACFFQAVHEDVADLTDYTIAGFVEFYHQHQEK